jgi:isoquinoline 1-oxidoreductase alpha subunit
MVQFKVNGVSRSFDGDPEMPLLWYLRDTLGLTGTKYGCGVALCGVCTVLENGKAIRSCMKAMSEVGGTSITTIEGIAEHGLHPVQAAWVKHNVPQCGYCQPGQIMQAVALVSDKHSVTDEQIDAEMTGNLCRCGTYQRIRAAIKSAAKETA